MLYILGFSVAVFAAIVAIGLIILAFEIWMFVDALRNPNISTDRKMLWALGMILLHPFVAIMYYFTDHQLAG